MPHDRDPLPPDTRIDCYRIIKAIGKGGFSLIYLAIDDETGDEVVIKEFMPRRIGRRGRDGRLLPVSDKHRESLLRSQRLFFQEAKAMAMLRHPHIVAVRGCFLANGTGYLIMQHERGRNLGQYIHGRRGNLSTTLMLRIFIPVLDALALMHQRAMLHLDVKPANIHLRNGHDPLLLDLGAVHLHSAGQRHGAQVITAGFSPPEQYAKGGEIGPWTDVYAVGASLRCCIEGKAPVPSPERLVNDNLRPCTQLHGDRYPGFLLEVIDATMQLDPKARPQDAGTLLRTLQAHAASIPQSTLRDIVSERTMADTSFTRTSLSRSEVGRSEVGRSERLSTYPSTPLPTR